MALTTWLVVGCAILLQRQRRRRKRKDLAKIPLAPGSLPLLGNIAIAQAFSRHKLHELLTEYTAAADERGILRMVVAGELKLLVTTPAGFASLRRAGFQQKPRGLYDTVFMLGMKRYCMLNTPDAGEHARIRKHFTRFFSADNANRTIGRLAASVRASVLNVLLACSRQPAPPLRLGPGVSDEFMGVDRSDITPEGALVNAFEFCAFNILRVVFEVFLEVDLVLPAKIMHDIMEQIEEVGAHPLQYHLLKRGLYPGHRRYRQNFEALYKFNCELVRAIFAKPETGDTTTFWAGLRAAYPDAMTDTDQFERAAADAAVLYIAGYDNLANCIMHTLCALAIDQDSQAAVAEELGDAGLLATVECPEPPAVTAEQLAGLSVLDAVCHESMRLLTPEPFGGFRQLAEHTNICGYRVPKGTTVLYAPWALHHNRRVWGEDASQWRPDRWLEGNSVAAAKKAAGGLPRFMPFSAGAQNCIGQALAMTEFKVMVTMVLSRLHVAVDAQRMPHLRTVEDYLADTITRVSLQRDAPAWLRMRPRVPAAA